MNKVDLRTIKTAADKNAISSFDHLKTLFQTFVHNCEVKRYSQTTMTEARALFDFVVEDIGIIKTCPECYDMAYYSPSDCFATPCTQIHLPVWVKASAEFCFWPAKLFKIENKSKVTVKFFGDYSYGSYPAKQCRLFSKSNPDPQHKTIDGYQHAMTVSFRTSKIFLLWWLRSL